MSIQTPPEQQTSSTRRFSGAVKIYGEAGFARIQAAHCTVVGVGGVGSWAAEALARSGVGRLCLVDLDHVAESNINRQILALDSTLGMAKIKALQARIHDINPLCRVELAEAFVCADDPLALIPPHTDIVLDCIDHAFTKAALIASCRINKIQVITCGGAGGKRDPSRVQTADLTRTEQDPLLAKTRKTLRQRFGFSHNPKRRFGVTAVFSPEAPSQLALEQSAIQSGLGCAGMGSLCATTATFGMVAAASVLEKLRA